MQDWTGMGAIVSGGASGSGVATASLLAQSGLRVTIIDLNETAGAVPAAAIGEPRAFAETVLHIMQNKMLNGETIILDGAIRMAPR